MPQSHTWQPLMCMYTKHTSLPTPNTQPTLHTHQHGTLQPSMCKTTHTYHIRPTSLSMQALTFTTYPLPLPTSYIQHNQQTQGAVCKTAQDVGMVCMHCGYIVWLVLMGSIPTCACFHSENVVVTCFFSNRTVGNQIWVPLD